ncbi:MAG: VWA domain-containing protein [bacterium]|nr:VWA domain-containing protein [bacterium]
MKLLLLAALCAAPSPAAAPSIPADELAELVRTVKRDRDDVDPGVFARIATVKTPQALSAMERCVGWIKNGRVVNTWCQAMTTFQGHAKLEPGALELLGELCFDAERSRANGALTTLVQWGDAGAEHVERVVREHNDPNTRSRACHKVALAWAKGGDGARVRLLIENMRLERPADGRAGRGRGRGRGGEREPMVKKTELRDALAGATPGITQTLVQGLLDAGTHPAWRRLLFDAMLADPGEHVTETLAKLTRDKDPVLALDALHALGKRKDAAEHLKVIATHLKAKTDGQRRAAVVAIGKLRIADPDWPKELFELATKKDVATRMGACHALADLRSKEAVEVLRRMLDDEMWQVRAEALWQYASLRKKGSIPVLIKRLSTEQGRLREDVARALQTLTARDFGILPDRWERWWEAEGESFEVPELTAALEAAARREATDEGRTAASFFGLRILSQRVCFVMDTSGSMKDPSSSGGGRTGAGGRSGPTRMHVAKAELIDALERFPDGDRFNMIFFATGAETWKRKLTAMSPKARRQATEHTQEQEAVGATAAYDALALAFQDDDIDTIYLLTDGEPTVGRIVDPSRLRDAIASWNETRRITIHGISVGRDSRLLRGLAEDSGGRYKRID